MLGCRLSEKKAKKMARRDWVSQGKRQSLHRMRMIVTRGRIKMEWKQCVGYRGEGEINL